MRVSESAFLVSFFTSRRNVCFQIFLDMTWNYFILLLAICASSCLAHGDHENHGVKGGGQQGIKSYGGYFSDHGHGQGHGSNFVHSQQYHQQNPYVYQPYGWNFNQPQRTYGKANN